MRPLPVRPRPDATVADPARRARLFANAVRVVHEQDRQRNRARLERWALVTEWARAPRGPHPRLEDLVVTLEWLVDTLDQSPGWTRAVEGNPELLLDQSRALLAAATLSESRDREVPPTLVEVEEALAARDWLRFALDLHGPEH